MSKERLLKIVVFFFIITSFISCFNKRLKIFNQTTQKLYFSKKIKKEDIISFEWIHSFEHIMWKEYYKVTEENSFELFTIVVEGFGAGIPAEMDCTYRYENGLIYMENIKGSIFKEFNWINSRTQLKRILINDEEIIKGENLPEREKIRLLIE